MTVTVTGAKYTGTLTSAGTTTLTDSAASFVAADFYPMRIAGLWNSSNVYKGMAWVKSRDSTTQLTLESEFLDATGSEVTQTIGDHYQISKNFDDVSGTNYSISNNLITSCQLTFGTNSNSYSVCFYDEFRQVYLNSSSGGPPALDLRGGLVVFGHLLDYASGAVTGDVSFNSTAAPSSGITGQVFQFASTAIKFAMFGGEMIAGGAGGSGHVGPGDNGTASEWCKLWNCTLSSDIASVGGGAVWSNNPSGHEVRDIRSYVSGQYAINLRWGDGTILGGSYIATTGSQTAANYPLSIFGSDAAGTYTIAAPYPKRLQAIAQPRSCLWRSNSTPTQTINYTNVLAAFHGTLTGTGPGAQTNATQNFYFSGVFSTLVEDTIATIKADADSSLEDSDTVDSSGITKEITVLRETQVANGTPTVRGPWTTAFFSYLHDIMSFAVATSYTVVRENSVEDVVFGGPLAQATDDNITETDRTTVDAYSTTNDLSRLYDQAKSYKCTLVNILYPDYTTLLISANGKILDLGDQNLTIDDSAGSAFTVTTGSSLITIDAGTTFAPSSKFDTITTTGTVDLADTTTIDGLTFDCDLNLAEVIDLDSVTVTTGALDFATAGTYAFSDCIIDEVTNSSGGAVTINATGTTDITTNTGPSITINYLVTVTVTINNQSGNPIPGVEVAIFQDNASRTVVLASTSTDASGQVSTTANKSLGAIIIRARQSAQTATFNTGTGINDGTEVITTVPAHNFRDGDPIVYNKNGGSASIGLTEDTTYYVNNITSTTLSLHTTAANAISDTSRVDLTAAGSETHLLDPVRYVATSATGTIGTTDFSATVTMITDSIVTG